MAEPNRELREFTAAADRAALRELRVAVAAAAKARVWSVVALVATALSAGVQLGMSLSRWLGP